MSKMRFAALASLALLGGQVAAAEGQGFYAGAALGYVQVEDKVRVPGMPPSFGLVTASPDGVGFKVVGGYKLNGHFAIELAYIDGGGEEEVLGDTLESDLTAVEASVLGALSFSEAIDVYARAGLLAWENELVFDGPQASNVGGLAGSRGGPTRLESDGHDLSWGLGVSFDVGDKAAIRLEYERADLDVADLSVVSLGGLFRF